MEDGRWETGEATPSFWFLPTKERELRRFLSQRSGSSFGLSHKGARAPLVSLTEERGFRRFHPQRSGAPLSTKERELLRFLSHKGAGAPLVSLTREREPPSVSLTKEWGSLGFSHKLAEPLVLSRKQRGFLRFARKGTGAPSVSLTKEWGSFGFSHKGAELLWFFSKEREPVGLSQKEREPLWFSHKGAGAPALSPKEREHRWRSGSLWFMPPHWSAPFHKINSPPNEPSHWH